MPLVPDSWLALPKLCFNRPSIHWSPVGSLHLSVPMPWGWPPVAANLVSPNVRLYKCFSPLQRHTSDCAHCRRTLWPKLLLWWLALHLLCFGFYRPLLCAHLHCCWRGQAKQTELHFIRGTHVFFSHKPILTMVSTDSSQWRTPPNIWARKESIGKCPGNASSLLLPSGLPSCRWCAMNSP